LGANGKYLTDIRQRRAVKGLGDLRKHQQGNSQHQQVSGIHHDFTPKEKTAEEFKKP
jgi:hypothetical protein